MGEYRQTKFLQPTTLEIDANGMEWVVHPEPKDPISFFLDRFRRYDTGCIRWHWHPQAEFVLAVSPLTVVVGEHRFLLDQGDALWINAGQFHMFEVREHRSDAVSYAILFQPDYIAPSGSLICQKYVQPLVENPLLPFVVLRRNQPWQRAVIVLLEQVVRTRHEQPNGFELRIRNLISEAWLRLFDHVEQIPCQSPAPKSQLSQQRLKQMVSFLHSNYQNRISLEDIARSALISKSECLRCFRTHFGVTPFRYLTEYRLETAQHLLRTTHLTAREIAVRCGFEDPGYFGKLFRREKGMTPLEYRRLSAGERADSQVPS